MSLVSSFMPRGLDRAGFVLSTACAVHCAVVPLVAGLLPLVGLGFLLDEVVETALLLVAAGLALASLAGGCRHHGQFRPLAMVAAGFALILLGRTWLAHNELWETLLVVAGALMVAGAHAVNWRLCCAPRSPA